MAYIMVDVETDGPIPGKYSMISIGAVLVDKKLDQTFHARLKPISNEFIPDALSISGYSREETLRFSDPVEVMESFSKWINKVSPNKPMFISDNNGYDWMFVCWYFHSFINSNPFGYTSQNLGSLYKGIVRDTFKNFKHLRKTKHTHDPLDDARGNAEALLVIVEQYDLKIEI